MNDLKPIKTPSNGIARLLGIVLAVLFVGMGLFFGSQARGDSGVTVRSNWTPVPASRYNHTATLLPTGKVLITGGTHGTGTDIPPISELYDPATGKTTATAIPNSTREHHTATLLQSGKVLIAGGITNSGQMFAELYDPNQQTWEITGYLITSRFYHTATLLADGKVLIVGGATSNGVSLSSAEIYDPVTGVWTATSSMKVARTLHTATLLPNGKVLVAGGININTGYPAEAELYDPATESWTTTGSLANPRISHTATLLPNGKVLVTGGYYNSGTAVLSFPTSGTTVANAELYDPVTGIWTSTGSLVTPRYFHTATLLSNGTVSITGGSVVTGDTLSSVELYDPTTETWTTAETGLKVPHVFHTATLLPSGKLFIAAGTDNNFGLVGNEEISSPDAGTWTPTGSLATARNSHTTTFLSNGKVLVAGGYNDSGYLGSAELYDPVTGVWSPTGSLKNPRSSPTATLLPNGKVLVAGGAYNSGSSAYLSSAELYDPASGTWTYTGSLHTARADATSVLLPTGRVLVLGGFANDAPLKSAELYDPVTGVWTTTGDLITARNSNTVTLLPNGKVLVTGGYNIAAGGYLGSSELYDPATGTWATSGSMSVQRTGHSATLLPNGKVLVAGGEGRPDYSLITELYDPTSGTWTQTGNLVSPRQNHTATLLPNGNVLIAGGAMIYTATDDVEIYDPAAGTWSTVHHLSAKKYGHGATLLANGKVLVVGGFGAGYLSTAELYDVGLGFSPDWQPQITTLPSQVTPGDSLVFSGSGLMGISGASSGNTQDSSTAYPLVQLRSLGNDQVAFLSPDATDGWSDTSFTSQSVVGFFPGPALVTVFSNGIPSISSFIIVGKPRNPAFLTYSANPAVYVVNQTIANNTPASGGGVITSYSIDPLLPEGLHFDPTTGVISGRPSIFSSAANYVITGINNFGSTSVTLNLKVVGLEITANTAYATNLTYSSATLNGAINSQKQPSARFYFQYGLTNSYGSTTDSQNIGTSGLIPFATDIAGLEPATLYHFRIVGWIGDQVTYGDDQVFTTADTPPLATSGNTTNIDKDSAVLHGSMNPNGFATSVYFQYGTSTAYQKTTLTQAGGKGKKPIAFKTGSLRLSPATTYHWRIVANGIKGTTYGNDQTFKTADAAPIISMESYSNALPQSVKLSALVTANGLPTTAHFQFGMTADYIVTTKPIAVGEGATATSISVPIGDLKANTVYHYRCITRNRLGVVNGPDRMFRTSTPLTDWSEGGVDFTTTPEQMFVVP